MLNKIDLRAGIKPKLMVILAVLALFLGSRVLANAQTGTSTNTAVPPEMVAWCTVSTFSGTQGTYKINWEAHTLGSSSSTTYAWSGSDNLSSSEASVQQDYTTKGLKSASVLIRSGSQSETLRCSADTSGAIVDDERVPTLTGSCQPFPSRLNVNWTANAFGPTSTTTFLWSGTEGLTGTTSRATKTYSVGGVKTANISIMSGGQALGLSCEAKIASTTASGCFIATAAFGTEMEPEVQTLRKFRDEKLLTNAPGKAFVQAYYKISPPIADFIRPHENIKSAVRLGLEPLIYFAKHLEEESD